MSMEVKNDASTDCGGSGSAEIPARRYRFGLGTALVLIAAAAPALALFAAIEKANPARPADESVVTLLCVLLMGIAIGAFRRARPLATAVQIGVACLALVAYYEWQGTRLQNYWLCAVIGFTLVIPLLIQRTMGEHSNSLRWRRAIVAASSVLLNAFLTLAAFGFMWVLHFCVIETGVTLTSFPPAGPTYTNVTYFPVAATPASPAPPFVGTPGVGTVPPVLISPPPPRVPTSVPTPETGGDRYDSIPPRPSPPGATPNGSNPPDKRPLTTPIPVDKP
jgi:hypothetical protein